MDEDKKKDLFNIRGRSHYEIRQYLKTIFTPEEWAQFNANDKLRFKVLCDVYTRTPHFSESCTLKEFLMNKPIPPKRYPHITGSPITDPVTLPVLPREKERKHTQSDVESSYYGPPVCSSSESSPEEKKLTLEELWDASDEEHAKEKAARLAAEALENKEKSKKKQVRTKGKKKKAKEQTTAKKRPGRPPSKKPKKKAKAADKKTTVAQPSRPRRLCGNKSTSGTSKNIPLPRKGGSSEVEDSNIDVTTPEINPSVAIDLTTSTRISSPVQEHPIDLTVQSTSDPSNLSPAFVDLTNEPSTSSGIYSRRIRSQCHTRSRSSPPLLAHSGYLRSFEETVGLPRVVSKVTAKQDENKRDFSIMPSIGLGFYVPRNEKDFLPETVSAEKEKIQTAHASTSSLARRSRPVSVANKQLPSIPYGTSLLSQSTNTIPDTRLCTLLAEKEQENREHIVPRAMVSHQRPRLSINEVIEKDIDDLVIDESGSGEEAFCTETTPNQPVPKKIGTTGHRLEIKPFSDVTRKLQIKKNVEDSEPQDLNRFTKPYSVYTHEELWKPKPKENKRPTCTLGVCKPDPKYDNKLQKIQYNIRIIKPMPAEVPSSSKFSDKENQNKENSGNLEKKEVKLPPQLKLYPTQSKPTLKPLKPKPAPALRTYEGPAKKKKPNESDNVQNSEEASQPIEKIGTNQHPSNTNQAGAKATNLATVIPAKGSVVTKSATQTTVEPLKRYIKVRVSRAPQSNIPFRISKCTRPYPIATKTKPKQGTTQATSSAPTVEKKVENTSTNKVEKNVPEAGMSTKSESSSEFSSDTYSQSSTSSQVTMASSSRSQPYTADEIIAAEIMSTDLHHVIRTEEASTSGEPGPSSRNRLSELSIPSNDEIMEIDNYLREEGFDDSCW